MVIFPHCTVGDKAVQKECIKVFNVEPKHQPKGQAKNAY